MMMPAINIANSNGATRKLRGLLIRIPPTVVPITPIGADYNKFSAPDRPLPEHSCDGPTRLAQLYARIMVGKQAAYFADTKIKIDFVANPG
jgi:hypothetical protein